MSTLNVIASIKATAGEEQSVAQALSTLAEATRKEAGCINYELYVSAAVPTTFFTVEQWQSQDDLDAHLKTPHIAEAMSVLGPITDGSPDIHPLTPVE